jgi:hypothetical protein
MSDKKLTDNEIKKALEICGTYKGKCTDCPAFIKVDRSNCKKVLIGALDIINRQDAEIERLKEDNEIKSSKRANIFEIVNAFERGKAEAYKEFAERLKENSIATFSFKGVVMVEEIDDLLKELESEKQ